MAMAIFTRVTLIAILATALSQVGLAQATAPIEQTNSWVIRAARLIDPADGSVIEKITVLVENGVVTEVGTEVRVPPGTPEILLPGQSLIPGLIDAHVHLTVRIPQGMSIDGWVAATPMAERALIGVRQARETLLAGFTLVRDIGNSGNYVDVELKRAVDAGQIWGPTIVPAGRIIAPFGGQSRLNPERAELGEIEYLYADSREEIVRAVRRNIHFGAEVIKIAVDAQEYLYSVDDIRTAVDEAAAAGRKVAAHVLTDQGARNAIEGGVASLEHAWRMSAATMTLAEARGTTIVTSDFTDSAMHAYRWPDALIAEFRALLVERLRAAYEHQLDIVFGSDLIWAKADQDRGTWAIEQIDSFVESGATPLQILQALTVHPARLLSMEGQRGRIAKGYAADIVAVPGNPLEEIAALKRATFVMNNGRVAKGMPTE